MYTLTHTHNYVHSFFSYIVDRNLVQIIDNKNEEKFRFRTTSTCVPSYDPAVRYVSLNFKAKCFFSVCREKQTFSNNEPN